MAFDPRLRVGVSIDGRKYTRKPSYYIDVSHIPSITVAVEEASRQLRRGIMYAMSSCPEDQAAAAAAPLKTATTEKRPRASAPPPVRDPNAVYAAVTRLTKGGAAAANQAKKDKEKKEKAEQEKGKNKGKDSDSDVEAGEEKDMVNVKDENVDKDEKDTPDATDADKKKDGTKTDAGKPEDKDGGKPKSVTTQWSSVRRAGPSILAKRPRPDEPRASVFQPSSKRRGANAATAAATATAAKTGKSTADSHSTASVAASSTAAAAKKAESATGTAKPVSKAAATPAKTTVAKTARALSVKAGSVSAASVPGARAGVLRRDIAKTASATGTATTKAKAGAAAAAAAATTAATALNAASSAAGANAVKRSSLPASWSQVGGSTPRRPVTGSSVLAMLRRGRGGGSAGSSSSGLTGIAAVRAAAAAASAARGSNSAATRAARAGGLSAGRGYIGPLPALGVSASTGFSVGGGGAKGPGSVGSRSGTEMPAPSSMGLTVQYIPGATTIDGVRPNGYTVSREGTVRPVVTFNPKSKLPHKLRQTSIEKLFEGWRDFKKESEADSLAAALKTEQEMYANSAGRVDYRAAITVKLKELRGK